MDKNGFVSDEDIQIKRNEEDEILPQVVNTPIGKMKIKPIPYGVAEEFQNTLEQGGDADTEQVYELLKDNVKKPEFDSIFPSLDDFKNNIKAGVPVVMLQKLMEISGISGNVEATEDGEIVVEGADSGN